MTARLRWRVAAVVAAAILVSAAAIGVSRGGAGSSSGAPSTATAPVGTAATPAPTTAIPTPVPTTVDAVPLAADVAAGRACQTFAVYLGDAQKGHVPPKVGRALADDAAALLKGSRADESAGRALPTWAPLGSDLLAAAGDIVSGDSSALRRDGAAAGAECRRVPAPAARAAGFARTG